MSARIYRGFVVARLASAALACGLSLLLAGGCATSRPTASAAVPSGAAADELWREYERAVEDARYPRPERISRDLVPIDSFFAGLVWDEGRQKVLMVTWSRSSKYTHIGAITLPSETWLTAAPFVRRFCAASGLHGAALNTRLEQRIGLPPNATYDVFVEMWVDPADFFRPCPDPEVNDRECQVNLTTGAVDRGGACPWSAALQGQVSGKFVLVNEPHLKWMCESWLSRYPPGNPRGSYPWTALGYTYDWAPSSRDHIGESEFVAPQGTAAVIRAITPTAGFCAPAN